MSTQIMSKLEGLENMIARLDSPLPSRVEDLAIGIVQRRPAAGAGGEGGE